jgi:hypothetical protein
MLICMIMCSRISGRKRFWENFGFEAVLLCDSYEGGMPIKDYFDELNRIILFMLLLDTVMEAAM